MPEGRGIEELTSSKRSDVRIMKYGLATTATTEMQLVLPPISRPPASASITPRPPAKKEGLVCEEAGEGASAQLTYMVRILLFHAAAFFPEGGATRARERRTT